METKCSGLKGKTLRRSRVILMPRLKWSEISEFLPHPKQQGVLKTSCCIRARHRINIQNTSSLEITLQGKNITRVELMSITLD